MRRTQSVLALWSASVLAGCVLLGCAGGGQAPKAQLFDGMGAHQRSVTTRSDEARKYFDQGLTWAYAFNHDEAIRSFRRAAELDPTMAAAWWGVALAHGPHVNSPGMSPEASAHAWEALQRAEALIANASEVERALIEALRARYAWPAPEDRKPLDEAYASAMRGVHARFPDDVDVATLFAEAMMDLQPWDYWEKSGEPKGNTREVVSVLESVLRKQPNHPGAAHLYIHAMEASNNPGRALAAADALRDLVPLSGHLVHMPSHIDVRVGNYEAAAVANRKAIAADAAYRALSPKQGFYRAYMQHNQGFLAFACMMLGREREALAAAHDAVTTLPADWVKENAAGIDGYLAVEMDALKRFGKWKQLLALPEPPEHLPFTRAMWRCNRAVAHAALGDLDAARREQEKLREYSARVPEGAMAQMNPARRVLELAGLVLEGEIAYAEKDYGKAERALRAAMEIEDSLRYIEPPDWLVPVRHTLGVVLLDAGRASEAEAVYREDLAIWPENGWALLGLAQAQEARLETAQAAETRKRLQKAWASADITPGASCLCAPR